MSTGVEASHFDGGTGLFSDIWSGIQEGMDGLDFSLN